MIKIIENASVQCTTLDISLILKICPILFKVSVNSAHRLPKDIGIWSGIAFFRPNASTSDKELAEQCEKWSDNARNRGLSALLSTLPACPPTLPLAIFDINYQQEDMISQVTKSESYQNMFMRYFHPNVSICYRQSM